MSSKFKINTVGIITNGEYKDWYVYVYDDAEGDTGGFYIFFSEERGGVFPDGYDCIIFVSLIRMTRLFFRLARLRVDLGEK